MKIKRKKIIKKIEELAELSFDIGLYDKWDAYVDVLIALRDDSLSGLNIELKEVKRQIKPQKPYWFDE